MPEPLILFIPRWYPSKEDPMLGLFVRKHAQAAITAGYRVIVAYAFASKNLNQDKAYHLKITKRVELIEVTVSYRPSKGISGMIKQIKAWQKAIDKAQQLEGNPAIIHAHVLTRTGLLALYFGNKYKVPYLVTEHWSRYYPENMQFKGIIRRMLTQCVLNKAQKITVVSERLAESMKDCGLKFNPEILPNVVDTNLFTPISKMITTHKKIVSITCFEEKSKNLFMLIDAFKLLIAEVLDVQLVLIGEGTDLELTKKYVSESGLKSSEVIFTGMLEGEVLADQLRTADCLALSSNYETFAIAVFESLASGVPVVVTDVADLSLHIQSYMGMVVPTKDTISFKEALLDVLSHPEKFRPEEMRKYVLNHFNTEAIAGQLNHLYKPLLQPQS
ncbi:MAG: glycosyltransferase [Lentimicrobium sp.]|jgi:glycosyltransferase involved in cell wall biosynthesis|nr:glycosyltransferase [Lentimicrobium sp.]